MKQFVDLVEHIIAEGEEKTDRTGIGTISIFGYQMQFNMKAGFPLLGIKETHFPSVAHELLWFLDAVPDRYKKFGNTNIKYLVDNKVNIWNEWVLKPYLKAIGKGHIKAHPDDPEWKYEMKDFVTKIKEDDEFALKWGNLGEVYGKQWKKWPIYIKDANPPYLFEEREYDQISALIKTLQEKPDDRGIIVSAWNVAELSSMALRPCHTLWQVNTFPLTEDEIIEVAGKRFEKYMLSVKPEEKSLEEYARIVNLTIANQFRYWWLNGTHPEFGSDLRSMEIFKDLPKYKIHLQLYQRSADVFLGVPFNIASYSLLLHMIAQVVNMVPGKFVHTFGDAHLYLNHKEPVKELLERVGCGCQGTSKNYGPPLPTLQLNSSIKKLEDFRFEDITLINYNHLGKIKAPVAI